MSHLHYLIVLVVAVMLVVGCGLPIGPVPSAVFAPTLTATSIPLVTPKPLLTLPIPTPTSSILLTLTPLPTLTADQAQALMLDLFRKNAGCRLPCWWGIKPSQTTWETAHRFLATFALDIKQGSSPERPLYSAYFVVPKEIDPNAAEPNPIAFKHNYKVIDGVVEVIEVEPGLVPDYELAEFLKAYGSPTEIWLRTYRNTRQGDLPFDVALFYPRQGILARYATQAKIIGNQIEGCPQQKPAAILALWSAGRELTFNEAASQTINIQNEEWWPYQPLAEATGMDVMTFYQTFQSSNNSSCLKTSADLWPQP